MEQSSSYDETTVRHQFDRKCKLALDGEVVDYDRHMDYRRKHEILFSELSECQTGKLSVVDEYNETSYFFKTCEYDVKVKSSLLAEALNALTDRKREVILLSYFMEMSDAAIARKMNLVRSTVHEHRTRSVRPARTLFLKVKVLSVPVSGKRIVNMARVSTVKWNLKEA